MRGKWGTVPCNQGLSPMIQKVYDREKTWHYMVPIHIKDLMERFTTGDRVEREERKQILEIIWLVYGSDGLRGKGYDFIISQPLYKKYSTDMETFMQELPKRINI